MLIKYSCSVYIVMCAALSQLIVCMVYIQTDTVVASCFDWFLSVIVDNWTLDWLNNVCCTSIKLSLNRECQNTEYRSSNIKLPVFFTKPVTGSVITRQNTHLVTTPPSHCSTDLSLIDNSCSVLQPPVPHHVQQRITLSGSERAEPHHHHHVLVAQLSLQFILQTSSWTCGLYNPKERYLWARCARNNPLLANTHIYTHTFTC